ncbi:hypothetical protein GCM10028789_30060 [Sinomonas halotolerans]
MVTATPLARRIRNMVAFDTGAGIRVSSVTEPFPCPIRSRHNTKENLSADRSTDP